MPTPEEIEAELAAMDAEIQQTCSPAPPEAYYQLGQLVGEERADRPTTSLLDAIGRLVWNTLSEKVQEAFREAFPHVAPGPYTGPIPPRSGPLNEEEIAQIRAEQEAGIAIPTHRAPMTHVGYIDELVDVTWFPLESLETHPLRSHLRNRQGRRLDADSWTVLEGPVMAFLSGVISNAREVPDWTTMVVFVSEPFTVQTGPILSPIIHDARVLSLSPLTGLPGTTANVSPPGPEIVHRGRALVPGGPEERVRFYLAYTRAEVDETMMPDWIRSRGHSRPEQHRRRRRLPDREGDNE